jgi:hypothetical protein
MYRMNRFEKNLISQRILALLFIMWFVEIDMNKHKIVIPDLEPQIRVIQ